MVRVRVILFILSPNYDVFLCDFSIFFLIFSRLLRLGLGGFV